MNTKDPQAAHSLTELAACIESIRENRGYVGTALYHHRKKIATALRAVENLRAMHSKEHAEDMVDWCGYCAYAYPCSTIQIIGVEEEND